MKLSDEGLRSLSSRWLVVHKSDYIYWLMLREAYEDIDLLSTRYDMHWAANFRVPILYSKVICALRG